MEERYSASPVRTTLSFVASVVRIVFAPEFFAFCFAQTNRLRGANDWFVRSNHRLFTKILPKRIHLSKPYSVCVRKILLILSLSRDRALRKWRLNLSSATRTLRLEALSASLVVMCYIFKFIRFTRLYFTSLHCAMLSYVLI